MIESKQQLLDDFDQRAQSFLADPNPMNGIDFDDAAVALKRYVLSVMHDQAIGSTLARFSKLIRQADIATLAPLVEEVRRGVQ